MKIIGITGGTGAGKSVLSAELEKCGATVIDADKISKEVALSGGAAYDEIVAAFGEGILTADGEIDRRALGEIVFSDKAKLELLEGITHKHIFDEMKDRLNLCKTRVAVLDVPLLFNCGFPIDCDIKVAVIADTGLRLARIMARDNISEEAAIARMKNQMTNEEYRALADICFENNGDMSAVREFAKGLID